MVRKLKEEVEKKNIFKKEAEASVLMKQEQLMMQRMKDEEDERLNRKYNEEKQKMDEIFKVQKKGKDEARELVQNQVSYEYPEKLLHKVNTKLFWGFDSFSILLKFYRHFLRSFFMSFTKLSSQVSCLVFQN